MNKEDIILLNSYLLTQDNLDEDMKRLKSKLSLIGKQIELQDSIMEINSKLDELSKEK